jgi:hypothetical protein
MAPRAAKPAAAAGAEPVKLTAGQSAFYNRMARLNAVVSGSVPPVRAPAVGSESTQREPTLRAPTPEAGSPSQLKPVTASGTAAAAADASRARELASAAAEKERSDAALAESLATRSRQLGSSERASSGVRGRSGELGPVALATVGGSISHAAAAKDGQNDRDVSAEAKNIVVLSVLTVFICICLALGEGFQNMVNTMSLIM